MTALVATLALLAIVWTAGMVATSALVSLGWPRLRLRLAGLHPATRSLAAFGAATAPAVVPTTLVLLGLLPGILGVAMPALDHCTSHPTHPHLCLAHPSATLTPGLLLFLGLSSTVVGVWIARGSRTVRAAERRLRQLAAAGAARGDGSVDRIESARPFSFTHGWKHPRILISSALEDALRPEQLAIVVAHERAHVRRRDPLRQAVARVLSAPLWPPARARLLADLHLSAEQACDEEAARRGDRIAVAETILAVERLMSSDGPTPPLAAVGIGGSSLRTRVQSLLDGPPKAALSRPGWLLVGLCCGLFAGAGAIHHETEHLLARWIGGA